MEGISLTHTRNNSGPKALPCGIPPQAGIHDEKENPGLYSLQTVGQVISKSGHNDLTCTSLNDHCILTWTSPIDHCVLTCT